QVRSIMQSTTINLGSSNHYGHGLVQAYDSGACGTGSGTNPPPPAPTTVTITDGFDTGTWNGGSGWLDRWTGSGSAAITTSGGPHQGSRHVRISSSGTINRPFDLSNASSATVSFWAKRTSSYSGSVQ